MAVRQPREAFDIQHVHGRIGQCFAKNRTGIGPKSLFKLRVRGVLVYKGDLDAQFFQRDGKKIEGSPVDAGRADHMVAALRDIEQGEHAGGLAG